VEKYADGKTPDIRNSRLDIGKTAANIQYPISNIKIVWQQYETHMQSLALDRALDIVWFLISELDSLIDHEQPWKLAESDKTRLDTVLYTLAESLCHIAWMLLPFMPETAQKIFDQLGISKETSTKTYEKAKEWNSIMTGIKIKRGEALFPRLT